MGAAPESDRREDTRCAILVVEDDERMARALVRHLKLADVAVLHVPSAEEARTCLAARPFDGAILDLGLPDGSGLEVLESLRKVAPATPVLVLTGWFDPGSINRVHKLGAEYAWKLEWSENVDAFVARVRQPEARRRLEAVVAAFAEAHGLSAVQVDILRHAVATASREALARRLGVSQNTLKSRIREILRRTGATSLEDVVVQIRERLLG